MSFEELVERERAARKSAEDDAARRRAESAAAWQQAFQAFERLNLPTIPVGWTEVLRVHTGFFKKREETHYRFHELGRGWVIQPYIYGAARDDSPTHAVVVTDIGEVYDRLDDHRSYENSGAPTGSCFNLGTGDRRPEPAKIVANGVIELLAKYAVDHQ